MKVRLQESCRVREKRGRKLYEKRRERERSEGNKKWTGKKMKGILKRRQMDWSWNMFFYPNRTLVCRRKLHSHFFCPQSLLSRHRFVDCILIYVVDWDVTLVHWSPCNCSTIKSSAVQPEKKGRKGKETIQYFLYTGDSLRKLLPVKIEVKREKMDTNMNWNEKSTDLFMTSNMTWQTRVSHLNDTFSFCVTTSKRQKRKKFWKKKYADQRHFQVLSDVS